MHASAENVESRTDLSESDLDEIDFDDFDEAEADLSGVRVVVVDDDVDLRAMIEESLRERGADVRAAASANEALELIAENAPDVLVSDIGLPEEDGYSLIARVRALPAARGGKVPAIALTGRSEIADSHRALVAGYQVHVAKPVNPVLLAHAVANVVGSAPLSRQ